MISGFFGPIGPLIYGFESTKIIVEIQERIGLFFEDVFRNIKILEINVFVQERVGA